MLVANGAPPGGGVTVNVTSLPLIREVSIGNEPEGTVTIGCEASSYTPGSYQVRGVTWVDASAASRFW